MIGVIADDLTGAAEIGAVGLRHGLRAEILTSGGKPGGEANLICVDTDSRACPPEEAAKRVAMAAELLRHAGATCIYKKVDSVLRGHVTAEVESTMKQLNFHSALLVPANPSLGRTIRDKRYFIKNKLIHKTEFARDPEHPRTSAHVSELLGRPQTFPIFICRPEEQVPKTGIVVGEAGSSQDVQLWAEWRNSKKILAAGGAEFFGALLTAAGHRVSPPADSVERFGPDRELFICGTISEAGREFLRSARKQRLPIFSLPVELLWGAEFTQPAVEAMGRRMAQVFPVRPRVILNTGLTLARERSVSRRLVEHLARLAEYVLRNTHVERIFAEGGATSAELVRRMGWPRLTVARELSPGVVMLAIASQQSHFLIIKPGSYIWPETILRGAASVSVSETNIKPRLHERTAAQQ